MTAPGDLVIIDNYDSFVYNLYQAFGGLGARPRVFRNDAITLEELRSQSPGRVVLSPGPGHPANRKDFGICAEILESLTDVPILGVCLGHQGIIQHFGGIVTRNVWPMHGKTSEISHDGKGLFEGLPSPFRAMRYHSLIGKDIPASLEVSANSLDDRCVMAVRHKTLPIYGVQFHPESIATEHGLKLLKNFLRMR